MKSSPYCSLLTGFFFGFVLWEKLTGIAALQITHLSVPPWIESGSKESVVLDSPPTVFMLNYTYISSDKERLRCQAEGVFPLPRLVLYEMTSHSRSRQLTTNLFQNEQLDFTGAYIVEVSKDLTTEELKGDEPRVFKCVLTIPGTEYLAERSVVFYPDATGGHDVAVCVTTALLITSLSIIRLVA
ncbi:uncharacterized protein LOC106462385 isoform X2 [Limulus polyphemus]|uniref:Uncharacterized protein LOC106462385 isoform X2 n=1 Tax=Limulus polyphemus TaxID=6850 RepID=A0ABM1SNY9_LIMPO|nr:uncharacterized protein LOC106462385 isoform X2 [Limulus polyphemus]